MLLGGIKSEYYADERVIPTDDRPPRWQASVAISGMSNNANVSSGFSGTIALIPKIVDIVYDEAPIVATTEVYIGAPMCAWSYHIWYRDNSINPFLISIGYGQLPNAIQFDCFGRAGFIYASHRPDGITDEYLSVTYLGDPIDDDKHGVLTTFIGYITGGRARNALTETFANNKKLKTTIHDRGEETTRKQPPIPIDNARAHADIVTRDFGTMLREFSRWKAVDPRSFDAIFHHYAEGVDSNYPVTRVLRLSIALEAFINLVTQDKAENEKIIEGDFGPLKLDLLGALDTYSQSHRDVVSDNAQSRFSSKIENLNSASNTKRINRFWELVPIAIDKDDRELLRKLRNQSAHQGFLGEGDGDQDVLGDAHSASRLCDILNRAILHYAKYTGPVLSSVDGRWIDGVTGDLYQLPPVPHGGNIEIQHQISPPPLSDAEKRVVDALLK